MVRKRKPDERAETARLDDLEARVAVLEKMAVKPNGYVGERGPYYVGDGGTTDELTEVVRKLLAERPLFFREILDATGARDNRVKGVIVRLQREGHRVVDVSPEGSTRALWFIPSDAVLDRLLQTKRATERW